MKTNIRNLLTIIISHIHSIRKFKWEKLRFLRDLKGQKVHKRDRKKQVYIHSALRLRSKYKAKRGGGSAQRGNQGTQPVSVVHKSSTLDPTCLHPPAHPRPSPPVLWLFLGPVARTSARRQAEIQSCVHIDPLLTFLSNFLSLSVPLPHPPTLPSFHNHAIMLLVPSFVSRFLPVGAPFFMLHRERGGEGARGGQVTHADLIWNRVNTRFPANIWLGTKTGMVVCGPNEMRIVFDVTVLPGVIVD